MNQNKKSPLTSRPLRNPGQSLDEKINSLIDDKGSSYAFFTVVPSVLAMLEWYRWYRKIPYTPWIYTFVAIICASYGIFKLVQLRKEIRQLKLGRDGEKAVGQYLERLRENGCKVFHDIVGDGFNIDHVIISKNGVFTIETKTYSKPVKGEAVITNQGTKLFVNGYESSSNILVQAKSEANWLCSLLKEITGKNIEVKPVIVFPGWYINNITNDNDIWVLNPKALPKYIENNRVKLTGSEVRMFSYSLSQHIRNNERASA